jgi:hypothetical protein
MGVYTTEMNSNMWSVLTNSKVSWFHKWSNFCNHVENEIEPEYWKSDHIIEEIPKIIINLDSDSDTDSDGDHDSEGETTDMSMLHQMFTTGHSKYGQYSN